MFELMGARCCASVLLWVTILSMDFVTSIYCRSRCAMMASMYDKKKAALHTLKSVGLTVLAGLAVIGILYFLHVKFGLGA